MERAAGWRMYVPRWRIRHDRIFVSYRRGDGEVVFWIVSNIQTAFGADRVFLDTRDIEPGVQFADEIKQQVQASAVVLPIIGAVWKERIPDLYIETDWVRQELEIGLAPDRIVIPVLNGVNAHELEGLPLTLQGLLKLQAVTFAAVPKGASPSELHPQWALSLQKLLDTLRKQGFRSTEIRASVFLASQIALCLSLLILLAVVLVGPLYAVAYIGADWRLFAAPLAVAIGVLALIPVGVSIAPYTLWSAFANLARHSTSMAVLPMASVVLMGSLFASQPLSKVSTDGMPSHENACDSNYQVKRFDTISATARQDQSNPCETEFNTPLTIIEVRTGSVFPALATGRVELAASVGRIKAIRVPHAITLIEDANSSGVVSLPFALSALKRVSTPFVIWVATEPQGGPVSVSLRVSDQ